MDFPHPHYIEYYMLCIHKSNVMGNHNVEIHYVGFKHLKVESNGSLLSQGLKYWGTCLLIDPSMTSKRHIQHDTRLG